MSYRKRLSYRRPSATTPKATAHGGVCSCSVPILDGPPPGFASIPAMPKAPGRAAGEGSSRSNGRKDFKF
jgi:hypothetical protein